MQFAWRFLPAATAVAFALLPACGLARGSPPPIAEDTVAFRAALSMLYKLGDGQCNGGVGGIGEHKCLVGGTCNEGGTPTKEPTETGTKCPGENEYLLCSEETDIDLDRCRVSCALDLDCTGFLLSTHEGKGASRCELQTKLVEFSSLPLECYTFIGGVFSLIGKGACRTKTLTQQGPANGTHYGYMSVNWVRSLQECDSACQAASAPPCVGIEYHPTAIDSGDFKCEVHFEELSADQMGAFQCWNKSKVDTSKLKKLGDGQCNGGVGGIGEHKCLVGGTCNEGGTPIKAPTETGTRCPGEKEYLLCSEETDIDLDSCKVSCAVDPDCTGFLLSTHSGKGASRCELQTKLIEFSTLPLDCYTFIGGVFSLIGRGACRTKILTQQGPANGTHYGYMSVNWVRSLQECESACRAASSPLCVGIEYHPTAIDSGDFKCEVHFQELSADQMGTFQCWNKTSSMPEDDLSAEDSNTTFTTVLVVFFAIVVAITLSGGSWFLYRKYGKRRYAKSKDNDIPAAQIGSGIENNA